MPLSRAALVGLAACTGCFGDDDELRLWPPPRGITVQAVAAGDLDGDDTTDLVVFGADTPPRTGVYLIAGRDIATGSGRPIRTYSTFVPRELGIPTAATIASGQVFAATEETSIQLASFDAMLAEKHAWSTGVTPDRLFVQTVDLGELRVVAGNESMIFHTSLDLADPRGLDAPSGNWLQARLVTSYAEGPDHIVVVATETEIVRARFADPLAWTEVRQGPAWFGQTAVDLDGDGRAEIVGFDPMTSSVCAIDPGASTSASCLHVNDATADTEVTIIAGTNLTSNPGLDILIAQANGGETSFTLVEDYSYTPGALTAAMTRSVPVIGPAHGRTVAVTSPGRPNTVLVFGTDGAISCVLGPC
ncbi:MAG: hypothetical protein HOV81_38305 [Kofleriaceae bacterium]|nr:hypothetical protein [Kofleriaceae bacterium]